MDLEEQYEYCKKKHDDLNDEYYNSIDIAKTLLDESLADQITLQKKYGRLYAHISSLLKESELESERAYSKAYTEAVSDGYKNISATEAKHVAQGDDKYYDAKILENKIFRLKRKIESDVDAIESRKYALKNITELVRVGAEKHIIG